MAQAGYSASAISSSLSVRQLQSFLVVADELHFGRAAARLHVSQPALSQQIARLEVVVGARLLDRHRVTVGLTPAGQCFRGDAEVIVRSATQAVERARLTASSPTPITVCHAVTIEWSLLPRLLEAVAGEPTLDAVWLVRSGEGMAGDLRAGSCDIALARHLDDTADDVEQEVLMWEQPAVYLSPEDPLAQRSSISLEELAGRRLRMFRREVAPKQYERWSKDLRDAGVRIDTSDAYRFGAHVIDEVSRGEYVTLGQASAQHAHPEMAVVPVSHGLAPLPITLATRRGNDHPQIERFAELARSLTAEGGPIAAMPWCAVAGAMAGEPLITPALSQRDEVLFDQTRAAPAHSVGVSVVTSCHRVSATHPAIERENAMPDSEDTSGVLSPVGPIDRPEMMAEARYADLNGKRIGFVWDYVFRGDEMFPLIEAEIASRFPRASFVHHEQFGNIHGKDSDPIIEGLPQALRDKGVDAVVVGVGNCGSCTPAVIRTALVAEKAGVPSVALVSSGFAKQARAVAKAMGMEKVPLAVYPGVIPFDSLDTVADKMRETVVPAVLEGFARDVSADEAAVAPANDDGPVFSGSYDEIQEHFHARGWTDGLPVTPPTPKRVQAFLSFTDRDPEEVLGSLPPANRRVTIRSVAVNAVMAGCRPEYMPLLVAAIEAIADPYFQLQHAGATPGWEPLVVISGPITKQLGFYSGTGALKVGTRPNTSIGRFLRMCFRNLAGWIPGETDKGTLGSGFHVAIAEDEDAMGRIGWQPLREDLGFSESDNVVTVQSVLVTSVPTYSGGTTPEELMTPLRRSMAESLGPWAFTSLWYGHSHALIVMSPAVAAEFARHGWSKDDIRRDLYEHLDIEAGVLETYPLHVAGQPTPLANLVKQGVIDASYAESDDPQRRVPMLLRPEWTNIVVVGDPGRNQSRIIFNNHEQGAPTSRVTELPAGWEAKLEGAGGLVAS